MSRAIITRAAQPLRGRVDLPGDKSISHRRALLSLLVEDEIVLHRFAPGEDAACTLRCLEALGKRLDRAYDSVAISGPVSRCQAQLDGGNSGTTARLLMGMLAGREGEWIITGDDSLSRRPMDRVAEPLRRMGAQIELSGGTLPAKLTGQRLQGIRYDSPVASAQVKSAVLLAGLHAGGITRYRERVPTRDHTERLLGVVADEDGWIEVDSSKVMIDARNLSASIPGDPSAASFWVVAALCVSGSRIELPGVLANPRRTVHFEWLQDGGARIQLVDAMDIAGEPVSSLSVESSVVGPLRMAAESAAAMMDEIPVLAVLATQARGRSEFRDVAELRVKESDRLQRTVEGLQRMGAVVTAWSDGFAVDGPTPLRGAEIRTDGDHRIAMAFAIAGLLADGETVIRDAESAAISYPDFWVELAQLAPDSVRIEL